MHIIEGNRQRLDGGAMFGHVPKAIWSKWLVADANNQIELACRGLLVELGGKRILFETGIGAFFEPKFRARYGVTQDEHVLLASLREIGLSDADIDFVIISHLHFDHAGGLLSAYQPDHEPSLLFPNAQFVVGQEAWQRALNPHTRDKASFIPGLCDMLTKSNRLILVDGATCRALGDDISFRYSNGHTPGLMHSVIQLPNQDKIIFASDLIPGTHWVHLPVTMGYDRAPELLIDEKKEMLDFAIEQDAKLFYTHDPHVAMSKVIKQDDRYQIMEVCQA